MMTKFSKLFLCAVIGSSLAMVGCAKEEPKAPDPEKQEAAEAKPKAVAKPAQAPEPTKGEKVAYVDSVMEPYELCRSLLAADKGEGIADCAKAMAAAAKSGEGAAPADAKAPLGEIVTASEALAALPTGDVEKLRLAYGEVSKPVVALLAKTPAAAKNYRVFTCPMAAGYQQWAQGEGDMGNPYMGTKMLQCGSEVHDHHQGAMKDGTMNKGDHEAMHKEGAKDGMHKGGH